MALFDPTKQDAKFQHWIINLKAMALNVKAKGDASIHVEDSSCTRQMSELVFDIENTMWFAVGPLGFMRNLDGSMPPVSANTFDEFLELFISSLHPTRYLIESLVRPYTFLDVDKWLNELQRKYQQQ